MSHQDDLVARAARVLPGGVLGSHRHGSGLEFVVREARGAYLWDVNGRRYLDHLLSSGPMVLGHAYPTVIEAVEGYLRRGTAYMLLDEPVYVSLAHADADVDEAIAIFDDALRAVAMRTGGCV